MIYRVEDLLRRYPHFWKKLDFFIQVVDARGIRSTFGVKLEPIFGEKRRVLVLSKCDLAEEKSTKRWVAFLKDRFSTPVLKSYYRSESHLKRIKEALIAFKKRLKFEREIRGVVVGVPNVGKSSLINGLVGKKKLYTGDQPGVTKGVQWVKVSEEVYLLDTPGVVAYDADDPWVKNVVSALGGREDSFYDPVEVGIFLVEVLNARGKEWIFERVGIEAEPIEDFFERMAKRFNFLAKGGVPDVKRAAYHFLYRLRRGEWGRVTIEEVEDWKD